jgi:hypothetical protein
MPPILARHNKSGREKRQSTFFTYWPAPTAFAPPTSSARADIAFVIKNGLLRHRRYRTRLDHVSLGLPTGLSVRLTHASAPADNGKMQITAVSGLLSSSDVALAANPTHQQDNSKSIARLE